jgi:HlyD family secretion protein
VLLVPNAALRFTPPGEEAAAKERGLVARLMPGPPPEAPKNHPPAAKGSGDGQLWVLVDGQPQPVALKTGVSNGRQTEVLGGELMAGMAVISDYQAAKK